MPSVLSKLSTLRTKDAISGTPAITLSVLCVAYLLYRAQSKKHESSAKQSLNWINRLTNSIDDRVNKEIPEDLPSDSGPTRPKTGKGQSRSSSSSPHPSINLTFLRQFQRLLKIAIPKWCGRETATLSALTFVLFARTFLSVYVAHLEGDIVKYVVRRDTFRFLQMLIKWFSIAIPATFINSMLRFLEGRLSLMFRNRLVDYSYRLYFQNEAYYRITVLDSRIEDDCAQRLTDDLETVATTTCRLYSQITKPLFDLLLIFYSLAQMTRNAKKSTLIGPVICGGVVLTTGLLLRLLSPRFGQLVSSEADKRGHLRYVHSRLITNAEEIAFYRGHGVENYQLRKSYRALIEHIKKVLKIKLWFVMLEQFLMKYLWGGAGMVMISVPILMSRSQRRTKDGGIGQRTQFFTTAKNLLISGSDAVERLMTSYKDVVELTGYVSRVDNMLGVFRDVANGNYQKSALLKKKSPILEYDETGRPQIKGQMEFNADGEIAIDDVAIVTPNGDVVCPSLTMHLKRGQNLLITGPNGCGKSSLFRIVSGLWPLYSGRMSVPKGVDLFYIPQRPYMTLGTLRDQIIYPECAARDLQSKPVLDSDLRSILRLVELEHLVERDGFECVQDWNDTLSGGEKQRMAVARMFYHRPCFALLDECTSAVSIDVEGKIYQTAIDMGIALLTITHRPTLWKFHSHILQFDGTGGWYFAELNATERLSLRERKESLLKEVPSEERDRQLKEICEQLAEDL